MTKQIKHKRTSKLGRQFPAGSRVEQIPIRVPQSVKNTNKYGEFENKEKFDDFKKYMEDSVRDYAYEDLKLRVADSPEDYISDENIGEAESNAGADNIEGMQSMDELKREYEPYAENTNLNVDNYIKFYNDELVRKNKGIHSTKRDKLYFDTLYGPIKHKENKYNYIPTSDPKKKLKVYIPEKGEEFIPSQQKPFFIPPKKEKISQQEKWMKERDKEPFGRKS